MQWSWSSRTVNNKWDVLPLKTASCLNTSAHISAKSHIQLNEPESSRREEGRCRKNTIYTCPSRQCTFVSFSDENVSICFEYLLSVTMFLSLALLQKNSDMVRTINAVVQTGMRHSVAGLEGYWYSCWQMSAGSDLHCWWCMIVLKEHNSTWRKYLKNIFMSQFDKHHNLKT